MKFTKFMHFSGELDNPRVSFSIRQIDGKVNKKVCIKAIFYDFVTNVRLRIDIKLAEKITDINAKFMQAQSDFVLNTSDGMILHVNKELLAKKSNILTTAGDTMPVLFGKIAGYESISVGYPRNVMKELLMFMSTGMVDAKSFYAYKVAILDASESLGVADMRELFGGKIVQLLSDENVLKIAESAVEEGDKELFEKCCLHIGV